MASSQDGPSSRLFAPVRFGGNAAFGELAAAGVSEKMAAVGPRAPSGACIGWGIPFRVRRPLVLSGKPVSRRVKPFKARWVVFMHTSDIDPLRPDEAGLISPMPGEGRLAEHLADYVLCFQDGSEARARILRRHQIGMFTRSWGENCFQCVPHRKPKSFAAHHEQPAAPTSRQWGHSQYRADSRDSGEWVNWLWAWENPCPRKTVVGFRFEPVAGRILVSAVSAGNAAAQPLRWLSRRKAVLRLPRGTAFQRAREEDGSYRQVQLDMGQVISAAPRPLYPNARWAGRSAAGGPRILEHEVLVEYTAHPDARFHLDDGATVPVARLERGETARRLTPVPPARQRVRVRVLEKKSRKPVPVRIHIHGQAGEYLAPLDRHRIPNPSWFEDYSADLVSQSVHYSTYIDGETEVNLPLGPVYVEVSKGFEIRPLRKTFRVSRRTRELVLTVENVLPWRERGWVSADTHVHFLSPQTALLEGAGEGVNVVNLLASQWGELMTNVGDFDGKTTFGAAEAGGEGEYLVRVGTENRQHVLGHISLLGYNGRIIAPMCSGGANESALGDAIDVLLVEWARQCRKQDGVVILPHFPSPRAENAVAIINGLIDGIETRRERGGISPYSLSDWYRYLNCGYFVPAVGGTDKMSATVAVGEARTYARLKDGEAFTYEAWKAAVRAGNTFVTSGPLLEFAVEGKPPGARMTLKRSGGTVAAAWQVASVTLPVSRVELVVNGEIRASESVEPGQGEGHWSVKIDRSSWLALLVRGRRPNGTETIAAHSSPVMVGVEGSECFAAVDALTILEQIEGALAYLDTVGTRAETAAYKRMRLELTTAHRALHNRMHRAGHYHRHTPLTNHAAHR
ncbi:MAG: CehA/McbA family metallohydrolase [Kiritimatiellae bacterium]|nr:CehA/McbA family metallohydrolase [Kiritimatiellia bacterium]